LQNSDAEKHTLGAMIRDNKVIADVMQIVRREDFYLAQHQYVFTAIVELFADGQPADSVAIANRLFQKRLIEDVRYTYLGDLVSICATAANAIHYAQIVKDRSIARSLNQAATGILRDVHSRMPSEELLENAERAIFSVSQLGVRGHTYPVDSVMRDTFNRIDARMTESVSDQAVLTGLHDADELLCGLQNSELCVVAARPSVGKTSLGLQIACNAALRDLPVFFVSLEMSRVELTERLLCNLSGVDSHKLRRGHASREDMEKLIQAREQLRGKPIHLDDCGTQSAIRVLANARRLKLRYGIRLLVLDYLQLLEPENKKDNRQEQVASMARRLKRIAKELEIPVLAMAQLNRQSEVRDGKRPTLADLRESGGIEADADSVLLLFRPEAERRDLVKIIVAKNRNGRTGDCLLNFRQECMRFENHTGAVPFGRST